MKKGNFAQASEKYWGAAAEIIKALAAEEGRELRAHAQIEEYVEELAEKTQDQELHQFFDMAERLHRNFYENTLIKRRYRNKSSRGFEAY